MESNEFFFRGSIEFSNLGCKVLWKGFTFEGFKMLVKSPSWLRRRWNCHIWEIVIRSFQLPASSYAAKMGWGLLNPGFTVGKRIIIIFLGLKINRPSPTPLFFKRCFNHLPGDSM